MRQVRETAAGKAISARVILNPKGEHVATVQAYHGDACTVDVWHTRGALDLQQGRASGYGYDKFTAALSGLTIDGHKMTDHCSKEGAPKPPKGRTTWPAGFKVKRGYTLANYKTFNYGPDGARIPLPDADAGYSSCFRLEGLKYLEALGYRVIQAI